MENFQNFRFQFWENLEIMSIQTKRRQRYSSNRAKPSLIWNYVRFVLEKAIRKLRPLVKMLQKDIMLHGTEKDGVVSVIMFFKSVSTACVQGLMGIPSRTSNQNPLWSVGNLEFSIVLKIKPQPRPHFTALSCTLNIRPWIGWLIWGP